MSVEKYKSCGTFHVPCKPEDGYCHMASVIHLANWEGLGLTREILHRTEKQMITTGDCQRPEKLEAAIDYITKSFLPES